MAPLSLGEHGLYEAIFYINKNKPKKQQKQKQNKTKQNKTKQTNKQTNQKQNKSHQCLLIHENCARTFHFHCFHRY